MTGFPRSGPWPQIRRDLERPRRRPVIAVVAFIGADAPTVMPLRANDTLVCDASELAVKRGLTNVAALKSYRKAGIRIFSISGLHAKVISSTTSAWIGSANASRNSEKNLVEASTRVTGEQARALYRWARTLATEDAEQTASDLSALSKVKVDRFRPSPTIDVRPVELPASLPYLWAVETGLPLSKRQEAAASSDRERAKSAAAVIGVSASLDFIYWLWDGRKPPVKRGDWLIDVRNGRVRRPAMVVRVRSVGSDHVVWVSSPKTARRPSVGELRRLEPSLGANFDQVRLSGMARTAAVLDLFR